MAKVYKYITQMVMSEYHITTSAGRDLERSGVSVLPASTFTLRLALWQKCTNISPRWLCRSTTSPPRLHDNAWCPNGSKAIAGQSRQQEEALVVSKPSHHEIAVRNSLGSKCVPGSPEGRTETQEVAKEAEAERR